MDMRAHFSRSNRRSRIMRQEQKEFQQPSDNKISSFPIETVGAFIRRIKTDMKEIVD